MTNKNIEDFQPKAREIIKRIEYFRKNYGLVGEELVPILASELHEVWTDAVNGLISSKKTKG